MRAVSIAIPPDKSISHRAVMLASISEGNTFIKNLLIADDIKRTIEAFQAMGVKIIPVRSRKSGTPKATGQVVVHGVGMKGLKKPVRSLYLGNSGTTMRILPGILAGQDFETFLTGDESLSGRPMKRIIRPLEKMGAQVTGRRLEDKGDEIFPPLKIHGGNLKAIKYDSKIASAQVKSCILLAGLYASGITSISEKEKSRDHTERMLKTFGCRLQAADNRVRLKGPVKLKSPGIIEIPGDISSAAFFIVAGCILPDTKIIIKNVGLNPTRTGILDILKRMGADAQITFQFRSQQASDRLRLTNYEPAGNIIVKSSELRGVTISPKEVVRAIDEIPVIMVAACFAKGKTVIKGVEELRVKETDRIHSMVTNLSKIGADIKLQAAGRRPHVECIVINGGRELYGAKVHSFGDHRTAMSMLVAGLRTKDKVIVTGLGCINKSFPDFERFLRCLL